jgi:hypothetical protein
MQVFRLTHRGFLWRVASIILALISSMFLPWWLVLALSLASIVFLGTYEFVLVGVFLDIRFGTVLGFDGAYFFTLLVFLFVLGVWWARSSFLRVTVW